MKSLSENSKKVLKLLFTDYLTDYNSNNIRERIPLSNAGSLKLLRKLSKEGIIISDKKGKSIFYKLNLKSRYVSKLLELIFIEHGNLTNYVEGWIQDLSIFMSDTKALLLFGSILTKGKDAKDVDVCFILKKSKDYLKVQKKVDELNKKSRLKIHPLYTTEKNFESKLKEMDRPLIDLVKTCVVIHGQEVFVKVLKNVQS